MPNVTPPPAGNPIYPAVILAGGLARRLGGGDKPLLDLGDRTVLDHVLQRLRPQAAPLALNANGDPARFATFRLPVLPDPMPGFPGPLAGILAAMRWAAARGAERVLTVPGDAPFIPLDLVRRLAASGSGIAYAASDRPHPTVALWPTRLAAALDSALASGHRRVRAWAEAEGAAPVPFAAGRCDPFLNINTVADLQAAQWLLHDGS
jgi:molybdopterin-guanine dinucleotide biosynthesis protein A